MLFNVFIFECLLGDFDKISINCMTEGLICIPQVQISNGHEQTHHEYHRLSAQLYHLRSLLCLDSDVVENVWSSHNKNDDDVAPPPQVKQTKQTRTKSSTRSTTTQEKQRVDCSLIADDTPKPVRRVKQKAMRKGRLYATEAEPSNTHEVEKKKKRRKSLNEANIVKCLDDLRQSLTILNPYTDTLIIKAIYQLLILLSGTSNKSLTIACQLLSSSRILHQQMLSACTKKLKDQKTDMISKDKSILETTSDMLEKFSDPKLVFEEEQVQYLMSEHIPPDWCVCSLSLSELNNKRFLIVCRLQRSKEPIVMKINLSDKPKLNKKDVVCDLADAFDEGKLSIEVFTQNEMLKLQQ